MISNKKLNPVVTELFIRGGKLNILIVFVTQTYFKAPKDIRINLSDCFITKIPNKRELQKIAINYHILVFKDFLKTGKKCTAEPFSFLVQEITLPSNNSLYFRQNLLESIKKVIVTIDKKVRDGNLKCDINNKAAKILPL